MINKKNIFLFASTQVKKMAKFERKQQNYLYFSRCPCYMQLFDKSEEQSIQLENAVMWSKSNLNIMNIYEEKYIKFLDMKTVGFPLSGLGDLRQFWLSC